MSGFSKVCGLFKSLATVGAADAVILMVPALLERLLSVEWDDEVVIGLEFGELLLAAFRSALARSSSSFPCFRPRRLSLLRRCRLVFFALV